MGNYSPDDLEFLLETGNWQPLRATADGRLLPHSPEPTLPAAVLLHTRFEIGRGEVGPQDVREHELAVGGLPQQEVAEAMLATGADHQIGVGHVGHLEV